LGRVTGSFVLSVELQLAAWRKRLIARLQCASSSWCNTVLGASSTNTGVSFRRFFSQLRSSRMNKKRTISSKENAGILCQDPCFWGSL